MAYEPFSILLVIPEGKHPGNIEPNIYTRNETAALLREHKDNPDAIQFIADMLEE